MKILALITIISVCLAAKVTKPNVIVPLYWGPKVSSGACSQSGWLAVGTSPVAKRTIAIVNPESGPGKKAQSDFKVCIDYLKSKGVKVIGYVHTKQSHQAKDGSWVWDGYRDQSEMTKEIDNWYSFYSVNGIFFDEISSMWLAKFETKTKTLRSTHALIQYVRKRSTTQIVVLNPGTFFEAEFLTKYDNNVKAIINEMTMKSWMPSAVGGGSCRKNSKKESFGNGPFCSAVPDDDGVGGIKVNDPPKYLRDYIQKGKISSSQLAVLLYGSTTLSGKSLTDFIDAGLNQNIGYYYITDKGSGWAGLPSDSMWKAQTKYLSEN